jgi:hypothetical protein
MMWNKEAWGALSVGVGIIAYALYIRRTTKKDSHVRPHPLSWLLWFFVTLIAWWVQITKGAHAGSWITFLSAAACLLIAILSWNKGEWTFSTIDWLTLLAGVVALVLQWLVKSPTAAAYFATGADVLGYKYTIEKGWVDPYSDDPTSFLLNSIKFLPAIAALDVYSVATDLYPLTLVFVNAAVAAMLWVQRARKPNQRMERGSRPV